MIVTTIGGVVMYYVKDSDYEKLINYALSLGVENAFIQEGGAAEESFIPDFDGFGVVKEV